MKIAINFDKVTHIKLQGRPCLDKSHIHFYVGGKEIWIESYDTYEQAVREFAQISDKMGLEII